MAVAEEQLPKTINTHWFGGIDKLPSTARYVGRPSPWGNAYSSKSGKYTREECVALHRIATYQSLIDDPTKLSVMRTELGGYDLACWCKQHKQVVGCHADNYLHVLSPLTESRDYTRSVSFYLLDDIRHSLTVLHNWVLHDCDREDSMWLDIHLSETKLAIQDVIRIMRADETALDVAHFLLAQVGVELELARQEVTAKFFEYRLARIEWVINKFLKGGTLTIPEPIKPDVPLKRRVKKTKDS